MDSGAVSGTIWLAGFPAGRFAALLPDLRIFDRGASGTMRWLPITGSHPLGKRMQILEIRDSGLGSM
jgi:hypothetical protein